MGSFEKRLDTIRIAVLGKKYDLDTAFVLPKEIHRLNKIYRGKNKPTDVLSFPFDKMSGQIVICPAIAKKEAVAQGVPAADHITFLFIHGLLHLKGFDHGSTMENKERQICRKFGIRTGPEETQAWHEQSQPA